MRISLWFSFALLWLMVPLSYFSYTSMGLGRDYQRDDLIIHQYFRVRWPGDGTMQFGGGSQDYLAVEEDIDWIDFAFRMFRQPVRRAPESFVNRVGFWRYVDTERPYKTLRHEAHWVAIPSPLVPILITLPWLWLRRRRQATT